MNGIAATATLILLLTAQRSTSRAGCFAPGKEKHLQPVKKRTGGPQSRAVRSGQKSLAEEIRNPDLLVRNVCFNFVLPCIIV